MEILRQAHFEYSIFFLEVPRFPEDPLRAIVNFLHYITPRMTRISPPLRAVFSPAHPLADIFHPPYPPIASQSISRDVPLTRARAYQFAKPPFRGVAKAALYCAHRTSTALSCAFCEQGGHLAAPFLILRRPRVARAQKIISLHPLFCSASRKSTGPLSPLLAGGFSILRINHVSWTAAPHTAYT